MIRGGARPETLRLPHRLRCLEIHPEALNVDSLKLSLLSQQRSDLTGGDGPDPGTVGMNGTRM
jgi:hypothetical protein